MMLVMMMMMMTSQQKSIAHFRKSLEKGTSVEPLWYLLCRNNRLECRYNNLMLAGNFYIRVC
jgi:hypothetical protein